ncbi:MAG: aminoacyl-tRNA hydrolase [Ruminococcaceae bacterium]|nr:aminoacyl-tRNA hydrolase [Oscillospiraceae bacterium]
MADIFSLFRKIEGESTHAPITHLVVGLGNPGKEYEGTRHNVGFLALDKVAATAGATVSRLRFRALTGEGMLGGKRVLFMKPQTYMNASGEAVAEAAAFYKIPPENIVVFCDDISFAPGRVRIRKKGSAGGHNGLKSIIACLSSDAFVRFKMGVGERKDKTSDLADFVLGKFPSAERAEIDALVATLPEALTLWLSGKEDEALNRFSK